jgi:cysteine desulfurase / selenocysteine lyase
MSTNSEPFPVDKIRDDFPILKRRINNKPLIYFDSAATSQKPLSVINTISDYYINHNANIHRGVHTLAEEATGLYETAREKIAKFINAEYTSEIIYTKNTTESINLVVNTWGRSELVSGDLVLLTEMEHHSNLVPWQMLAKEKDLELEFIPVLENGTLDQNAFGQLLIRKPKIVSFTHMSNVLGTINPVKKMIESAHKYGAVVLVDGAQSVPQMEVNVQDLDADFYAFSGHKMLGPTGIGILYGKKELLEKIPPFMGGGDMIRQVHLRTFLPNEIPYKFEAGTPPIAEVVGLSSAIEYLEKIGMRNIQRHEHTLMLYTFDRLSKMPGISIIGKELENRGGVIAFTVDGIHPHDVAQILDSDGIAVRAGHHCAMPLHERFQLPATTRASFYLYNTEAEIDQMVISLQKVQKMFN